MNAKLHQAKIAFILTAVAVLALAQLGSLLVNSLLAINETYVVNSLVHFTHVRNFGGIFGFFSGHTLVVALLASAVLLGLTLYLLKNKAADRFEYICFGLIVGAGASNVVDRIFYGSVVDFINIQGIPYWNYVFNTADVIIHLGVWPLVFRYFMSSSTSAPNRTN